MIVSAHQPAYLPWLGYFHKMAISDLFVMVDTVQFETGSFINRNRIKTAQGAAWLTIPVMNIGHTEKVISDMEISNEKKWGTKHWESLRHYYGKAPYFKMYSGFFEDLYKKKWVKLCDLLEYMNSFFVKELKINTLIRKQDEFSTQGRKQHMVLDLCKKTKADVFIFGALGKSYADADMFKANGVQTVFQNYEHPVYSQQWKDFIPNLSIVDLLFNVGPEYSLEIIMKNNITKDVLKEIINSSMV